MGHSPSLELVNAVYSAWVCCSGSTALLTEICFEISDVAYQKSEEISLILFIPFRNDSRIFKFVTIVIILRAFTTHLRVLASSFLRFRDHTQ